MLEKRNYEINKTISIPDGTVNGQGVGPVSTMRYGFFPMSFNGCEMIAIYNLLYLEKIGKPNLADICLEMYPRSSVLWGLFGSNPYLLHRYFDKRKMPILRYLRRDRFFDKLQDSKYGVISFWNAKHPFKGIHTVTVERIENGYRIYNRSNRKEVPCDYATVDEVVDKCRFICGYCLKK